ncbi:hypothetical protein [Aeromicrobium sp.]|uniref:hypothetical protein n=1 Tax=Aeromicrobium sp. TaxID=1871063 RepID=UPI003D6A6265
MLDSPESQRRIGLAAWVMAWVALVAGQLHALSRYRTDEGRNDLESVIVRAWAEPADDLLRPLLDWGSANTVYLTYGKIWFPVVLAMTLCAFVVQRHRRDAGIDRVETWAWRVALTSYVGVTAGTFAQYWTQWREGNEALLDAVFLVLVPFLLLTMIGSTFLGIVLIRRGVGLPAWLLALAIPGLIVISEVTSLGNVLLPVVFGFGLLGRRLVSGSMGDARSRDDRRAEGRPAAD